MGRAWAEGIRRSERGESAREAEGRAGLHFSPKVTLKPLRLSSDSW